MLPDFVVVVVVDAAVGYFAANRSPTPTISRAQRRAKIEDT
jgi:hypothetical protein